MADFVRVVRSTATTFYAPHFTDVVDSIRERPAVFALVVFKNVGVQRTVIVLAASRSYSDGPPVLLAVPWTTPSTPRERLRSLVERVPLCSELPPVNVARVV